MHHHNMDLFVKKKEISFVCICLESKQTNKSEMGDKEMYHNRVCMKPDVTKTREKDTVSYGFMDTCQRRIEQHPEWSKSAIWSEYMSASSRVTFAPL